MSQDRKDVPYGVFGETRSRSLEHAKVQHTLLIVETLEGVQDLLDKVVGGEISIEADDIPGIVEGLRLLAERAKIVAEPDELIKIETVVASQLQMLSVFQIVLTPEENKKIH